MANLKISQLPLYTGNTAGFYIPVNNSGETTTYKITRETLIGASGTSGSSGSSGSSGTSGSNGSSGSSGTSGSNGSSGSSGTSGSNGSSGSSGTSGAAGSSGTSGTSGDSFFQSGTGENSIINIYQSSGDTTQAQSAVIGGFNNSIGGNTSFSGSTIIGGFNNDILQGSYNGIFAGHQHEIGNGGGHHGLLAGQNNTIGGEYNNVIDGGINNVITWGESQYIAGSNNSTIGGGANCYIIGGFSNGIQSTFKSGILGGESSYIQGDARFSNIINGYNNYIYSNGEEVFIVGSRNSYIEGVYPNQSGIYSSTECAISGNNADYRMVLIGSYQSGIAGLERTIGLGLSGRTLTAETTTHTENLHAFGNITQPVIQAGSVAGSINVDLSSGDQFLFTLTGNTSVSFINKKEGQRVLFFVYSTGTHNITAMTITGGSVYTTGGSLPTPTNNGYTMYEGWVMGGNMILLEHDGLAAI